MRNRLGFKNFEPVSIGKQYGFIHSPENAATHGEIFSYSPEECERKEVVLEELALENWASEAQSHWLNFHGLLSPAFAQGLQSKLSISSLVLEDLQNSYQRPRFEPHSNYLYLVVRLPRLQDDEVVTEQINLIVGSNWLLSCQEVQEDAFGYLRERLETHNSLLRKSSVDFLACSIVDACIDQYFPILEHIGESLSDIESKIYESLSTDLLSTIRRHKTDLLVARRALWPMRDALQKILSDPPPLLSPSTKKYWQEILGHTLQLIEMIETYRESVSNLMELYRAEQAHRMNQTMRFLTLISTIFLPMTFIAGLYGMNFDVSQKWNMPETRWEFGYIYSIGAMLLSACCLIFLFKRKGWLRDD